MFKGKPIIGLVGGIGSGKSFVARAFCELGCMVLDSDQLAHEALASPQVKATLRQWGQADIFTPGGEIDTQKMASEVFSDNAKRQQLERLLHPLVARMRQQRMEEAAGNAQVLAFVWDTPLLIEADLAGQCDAVVFVDAPLALRQERVHDKRGWDAAELARRENLQVPLDKKREISDYAIGNTADAEHVRGQVREVLSCILAKSHS